MLFIFQYLILQLSTHIYYSKCSLGHDPAAGYWRLKRERNFCWKFRVFGRHVVQRVWIASPKARKRINTTSPTLPFR